MIANPTLAGHSKSARQRSRLNASITSIIGIPVLSVYNATKTVVRSFAPNWILDLKDRKLRVNAISPSVIPTPDYNLHGTERVASIGIYATQVNTIPLGRVGKPDEIAKAVDNPLKSRT